MEHKKVYNILCWKYSTWLGTGKKMLMESKSSPLDNLISNSDTDIIKQLTNLYRLIATI
jgi:hypothetical protein